MHRHRADAVPAVPDSFVLEALAEAFTWIGLGAAILLLLVAGLLALADGRWRPVEAMIDHTDEGDAVARWFDGHGGVGAVVLTDDQREALGAVDTAEVYCRDGVVDRVRLKPGSPVVAAFVKFAAGMGAVGLVAAVIQIVLMAL